MQHQNGQHTNDNPVDKMDARFIAIVAVVVTLGIFVGTIVTSKEPHLLCRTVGIGDVACPTNGLFYQPGTHCYVNNPTALEPQDRPWREVRCQEDEWKAAVKPGL